MAGFEVTLKESNGSLLRCELVGISTKSVLGLCSALALALSTAACSSDNSQQARPANVNVPGVNVELIDAGAAPREPLVWFSDDSEQKLTFSATQGLEQKTTGGSAENVPYAEVTMNLPLTASASTDGKERTSTVTVGKPSGTNKERNEDIASAEGFQMVSTQGVDGRVKTRTYTAPDAATDSARVSIEKAMNQMNDYPLVFPSEPVGVGGQWKVSSRVDDGISMLQDLTYTLVERKGQAVSLKVQVQRRPAVSSLPDTDLSVLNVSSTSNGQLNLDLNRPLPVRGTIDVTTNVTYGKEDSDVRVLQEITAKSRWEPRS